MKIFRRSLRSLAVILVIAAAALPVPSFANAADGTLPEMCNGRSDASTKIVAIANGSASATKYVLSVETNGAGSPTGTLVLGQGADRLFVEQWCRLWVHIPGTTGGGACTESHGRDDATTAHAVGTGRLGDGRLVTVRTDVRRADGGLFFRVRYRAPIHEGADSAAPGHDEGCDGGWTSIPVDGWYPLKTLRVQVGAAS